MTELSLYKFIEEHSCETNFDGDKAIIWVSHFALNEFVELIGGYVLENGGLKCRLQEHCIAIDMIDICEHHDIDPNNVFERSI